MGTYSNNFVLDTYSFNPQRATRVKEENIRKWVWGVGGRKRDRGERQPGRTCQLQLFVFMPRLQRTASTISQIYVHIVVYYAMVSFYIRGLAVRLKNLVEQYSRWPQGTRNVSPLRVNNSQDPMDGPQLLHASLFIFGTWLTLCCTHARAGVCGTHGSGM